MAALKNQRWELFSQARAKGSTQAQAAVSAGFSEKTAESQGQRLNKDTAIQKRIVELKRKIVEPTQQPVVFIRQAIADRHFRLTVLQEFVDILRVSVIDDEGRPKTHIMRETRECLKQAAIEVGDWDEKHSHRVQTVETEDLSHLTPDQLFAEKAILDEALDRIDKIRQGARPLEIEGAVQEVPDIS